MNLIEMYEDQVQLVNAMAEEEFIDEEEFEYAIELESDILELIRLDAEIKEEIALVENLMY